MSPFTFTLGIIICCSQIMKQSGVNGQLHKPSLDLFVNNTDELIVIGDTVQLHCANSTNAQKFFLTKHGQTSVTREQVDSMFVITNISSEYNGMYTCKYSWDTGMSEDSDPVDIYVKETFPPPDISAEPRNIVQPGEDITIKCSASYPNVIFTLYKGDTLVKEGAEDELSYTIRNAQERDGGQYMCTYKTKPDKEPRIQSTLCNGLMIKIKALARPFISWAFDPENSTQLNINCKAPEKHGRMWFQLLNASKGVEEEIRDIRENQVTFVIENPDRNQNLYFCIYRIKMGYHFADSVISDPIIWGVHEVNIGSIIRHIFSVLILILMGVIIVIHVNTFKAPKEYSPNLPTRKKLALDSDYTETKIDHHEEPTSPSDTVMDSALQIYSDIKV